MFHKTFCPFDDHLGNTFVMFRKFIKGGIDNFHILPFDRFLDIRNLLRSLIDQKDDHMHIRVIAHDRFCHFF